MADRTPQATYPYADFSELAGPLQEPTPDSRVRFRPVTRGGARLRAWLLVSTALLCEVAFLAFLLRPANHPEFSQDWQSFLAMALIGSIAIIEGLRLVNVCTLAVATLNARDPVPVVPLTGQRLAFITTIVPGKEPIEMVRRTLEAAVQVRYEGTFHVWLLDEGDDPAVRALCAELGVRHFSRAGVPRWNQSSGPHKARTKHGNYNAWLEAHGDEYDFWVSVDTDHVPMPNMAERLMGYFHDPDVAFVVGPQVYGNYDNFVTRAAESQQYLFHSVLQRAANRSSSAMFVGTNNAVRIAALRAVGGLQDSITEDAATSLVWHAGRNPRTGAPWKSVYTPDVLAVGEGPSTWRDYFTQQGRWARGTDEVVLRRFWRLAPRLSFRRLTHYALLMSYYPAAAISWVLGIGNLLAYLLTGVAGLLVSAQLWLVLYVNAAVLQVAVYFWNRKHNVSPHEEEGSSGVSGMAISVMSAPLYVSALLAAVRNRSTGFHVTRKGAVAGDRLGVFGRHLGWAAVVAAALVASQLLGHTHAAIRIWAVLSLVMSLLPVAIWSAGRRRARQSAPAPAATAPAVPAPSLPVPSRPVLAAPDVVPAPAAPAVRFVRNRLVDVPQTQESTR
ncbi:Glycosyltransferase, catalytic subunit of cellulose synthase and poly-beta-1,6-N-acetylglucosamine synthase [Geodermatophilus saharensis]|uniref:Glycosyltransferase, catalytic subunit of cellulose synthase and poly-beta-1,6-N-acetylglucosamine synthase n=1 Tax=Geodermatophilus saharensis TaxID=1137994 RepID=A0A239FG28_9ACTN|nr:cellulose synthase catalytic subunit [Geodermatophilus saharensis]SNS55034.1 Glycosyltransferase, catalytic subunit of cellulose synthase and poly-beta-1,6-N-acetylglucosamine synthase [Geodermatophilus saharensis]